MEKKAIHTIHLNEEQPKRRFRDSRESVETSIQEEKKSMQGISERNAINEKTLNQLFELGSKGDSLEKANNYQEALDVYLEIYNLIESAPYLSISYVKNAVYRMSIIYSKLKDHQKDVEILERYITDLDAENKCKLDKYLKLYPNEESKIRDGYNGGYIVEIGYDSIPFFDSSKYKLRLEKARKKLAKQNK